MPCIGGSAGPCGCHSLRLPRSVSTGDATVRVSVNTANNSDADRESWLHVLSPENTDRQHLAHASAYRFTCLLQGCRVFQEEAKLKLPCYRRSALTYQFGPGMVDLGLTRGGSRNNHDGCVLTG